jgi:hypothetical protein
MKDGNRRTPRLRISRRSLPPPPQRITLATGPDRSPRRLRSPARLKTNPPQGGGGGLMFLHCRERALPGAGLTPVSYSGLRQNRPLSTATPIRNSATELK